MTECSICGRGGALSGGPVRYCQGHCVCPRCWDGIACVVLSWVDSQATDSPESRGACVKEILAAVATNSRR